MCFADFLCIRRFHCPPAAKTQIFLKKSPFLRTTADKMNFIGYNKQNYNTPKNGFYIFLTAVVNIYKKDIFNIKGVKNGKNNYCGECGDWDG
jgi:hypothetical protein